MHLVHTPYDQKIGSLIFIANPFFFLMFINSFFPHEFSLLFNRVYTGISAFLFLMILAVPNTFYLTAYAPFNKVIMGLLVFYAVYMMQGLVRALHL